MSVNTGLGLGVWPIARPGEPLLIRSGAQLGSSVETHLTLGAPGFKADTDLSRDTPH